MASALYVIARSTLEEPTFFAPLPTSSMSDNDQIESPAVRELDALVRHLVEELGSFRRRALTAEARLKELEAHEGGVASFELATRVAQLERENEQLQSRLESAGARAKQMLDRVRFLRQQTQGAER
jgi:hypothetical protein